MKILHHTLVVFTFRSFRTSQGNVFFINMSCVWCTSISSSVEIWRDCETDLCFILIHTHTCLKLSVSQVDVGRLWRLTCGKAHKGGSACHEGFCMNWNAPHDAHHRELLVKPPDLHAHFPKITNCRRGQHLQAWYVEARSFAHNVAKPEAGRSSRCCHELATDVTDRMSRTRMG